MARQVGRREFLRRGVTAAGALSLAACSGDAAVVPRPAPARTGGPDFKLGLVLPASGPDAAAGDSIRGGMQLYLQQNGYRAGGRGIALVGADEGGEPATALAAMRSLVEGDRVDLVAGCVSSAGALAARGYLDQRRVPTLIANAPADALSRDQRSPYVYRTSYSNWQLAEPMGRELVARDVRRLVLVYGNDSAGPEMAAAVKETYTGQVLLEVRPVSGTSGSDFGASLAQINDLRPDAVFAALSGADAVAFLREARMLNAGIRITGTGFLVEQDVLGALGGPAPLGAVTGLHWAQALDIPENRSFVAAYQRAYGRAPDVYAVHGYDTAAVVVAALRATGGRTDDRAALLRAISQVSFRSPRGLFRFDPATNNVIDTLYVRQLVQDPVRGPTNKVVGYQTNIADPGR